MRIMCVQGGGALSTVPGMSLVLLYCHPLEVLDITGHLSTSRKMGNHYTGLPTGHFISKLINIYP